VLLGQQSYPDDLSGKIGSIFPGFILVDGLKLATDAGNPRAANTVLLGAVSRKIDITEDIWEKAITKMVPRKALEVNMKAFRMGRSL
jgi:indolepyruvate ferredoxin oxidoreductase beta subunit